jgi:hypothetical protein
MSLLRNTVIPICYSLKIKFCYSENYWIKCDDTIVRKINFSEAQKIIDKDGYIVLYKKDVNISQAKEPSFPNGD